MEALRFTGSGSEYFKIWIVNILLTIITLGFYYPWAKVRNRRYFYANTHLADRNFEYHATGKQLLLGFIIGLFFFGLYTFVTQVAPQLAGIFILLLMVIMPWLIWRSLMFNMKVTSFSNVHFSFKGTLKRAYMVYLGYPFLGYLLLIAVAVVVSILGPSLESIDKNILIIAGIIFAVILMVGYLYFFALVKQKAKEYTINNSYYGQGKFSTNLELRKFMSIYAKAFGVVLLPFIILGATLSPILSGVENLEVMFFIAYIGFFIIMFLVMAYVVSRERAYVYANTLLDNKIAMASTLSARALAMVMITNLLMVVFTLGLATPWAKVRMARLMLNNTQVDTSVGFDEYITQQQNSVGAIGEEIGEAFDVDMDIGF
jgi:uncharacterized membrane protein YjgN (DUF898 family)